MALAISTAAGLNEIYFVVTGTGGQPDFIENVLMRNLMITESTPHPRSPGQMITMAPTTSPRLFIRPLSCICEQRHGALTA
jgi:hypothetical protein